MTAALNFSSFLFVLVFNLESKNLSFFFSFRSFPFCKKKMWSILIDQNIIVICLFLKKNGKMIYYAKQKVKKNSEHCCSCSKKPKSKKANQLGWTTLIFQKFTKKGIQSFKIDHYRHQTNNTHLHRVKKKKSKIPSTTITPKRNRKFFLPSPRIPSEKNQISLAVTPQKHFWKKK